MFSSKSGPLATFLKYFLNDQTKLPIFLSLTIEILQDALHYLKRLRFIKMLSVINRSGQQVVNLLKLEEKTLSFKLRHCKAHSFRDFNFSDTFHHIFTNTKPISHHSVCIASSAVAHAKNSSCWINRKIHFSLLISYRNYNKCSRCCISANFNKISCRQIHSDSKKMVWISDLDNPKVI